MSERETLLLFSGLLGSCLLLSFLFSGMEGGVLALSRLRIRQQMKSGRRSAVVLYRFLENPENFLWTILIGNTIANFTVLSLTMGWLYMKAGTRPVLFGIGFVLSVFLFVSLCDLLPKTLFRMFPNRLCLMLALPFRLIHLVLSPLVIVLAWFSDLLLEITGGRSFTGHLFRNRSELRLVMQENSDVFTSEERVMINRVMDLQKYTVRYVTTPLARLTAVDVGTPVHELVGIFRQQRFSRLPVWGGEKGRKRIVGIVSLDGLMFGEMREGQTAKEFMTAPLYLDEDMVLEEALTRMQRQGVRLAVVVGRDERELGVVSLLDLLKVIFGEVNL